VRGLLLLLLIVAGVASLLPPFFTHGACTAEFDAVSDRLSRARSELLTLPDAQRYLGAHGMSYQLLSAERCESSHPPDVLSCPSGALLLGAVPVRNWTCRYYRDSRIRFQLAFNNHSQLVRIQTDMNPYKILRLPGSDLELYVAR
jgi:hypothetical protein